MDAVAALPPDGGLYHCSIRTMYRILLRTAKFENAVVSCATRFTPSPSYRRRSKPGMVMGHHQAVGACEVDLFLPLCDSRHLQPLRSRLVRRRR